MDAFLYQSVSEPTPRRFHPVMPTPVCIHACFVTWV